MTTRAVHRATDRFVTRTDWLTSRHSFSFGTHYDAANVSFGLLLVSNDDVVEPGTGFDEHVHTDMEIVTWVLEGELTHRDSEGGGGVVRPGVVQRMSAGAGVHHSERNEGAVPVRFVQMWMRPHELGGLPAYAQADVSGVISGGGLVPVASGRGHDGAVTIRQRDAALHAARLAAGSSVALPPAPYVHVFVATGELQVDGVGALHAGDALRATGLAETTATAAEHDDTGAPAGTTELLVWEMHSTL